VAEDVERTEEPTPRRRAEARRMGQVAVSTELLTVANLLAASAVLLFFGPGSLARGTALFHRLWSPRDELDLASASALLREAFGMGALVVAPVMGAALLAVSAATLAQTRGNLATGRLEPRLANLSPARGLRRILKDQAALELAKTALKLLIVGGAVWLAVGKRLDDYLGLAELSLYQALGFQLGTILRAFLSGALALLLVAALDYTLVWRRIERALRMSRSEIRDEMRQTEGDPLVRARMRSMHMERARTRMMDAVKTADVVVTNPEHLAVALVYRRREMNAPTVVAKGRSLLAQRIRELAQGAGVPIVRNPPLARALYRSVKVGQTIPERLYQAVAEVLGYVYRLDRAKARRW
jgi:flagellar biosynthetic protein FlhB